MNTNATSIITTVNAQAWTDSLLVAEKFSKRHTNVIRAIKNLECHDDFMRLNFELHSYLDERGNVQPIYRISRDGFSMLAMGFTGKEATSWKLKFLAAFNTMERHLMQEASVRQIARDETKTSLRAVSFALKSTREEVGKETPAHIYSNEARMINAILIDLFGTDDRTCLTKAQLKMLDCLQQKDMLLIAQGRTYQERKDDLRAYSERLAGIGVRLVGHPNGTAANQALRRAA